MNRRVYDMTGCVIQATKRQELLDGLLLKTLLGHWVTFAVKNLNPITFDANNVCDQNLIDSDLCLECNCEGKIKQEVRAGKVGKRDSHLDNRDTSDCNELWK